MSSPPLATAYTGLSSCTYVRMHMYTRYLHMHTPLIHTCNFLGNRGMSDSVLFTGYMLQTNDKTYILIFRISIAAYCRLEFVLVIETVAKDRILALFVVHSKGKRCTVVLLLTILITFPPNSHIQGYSPY